MIKKKDGYSSRCLVDTQDCIVLRYLFTCLVIIAGFPIPTIAMNVKACNAGAGNNYLKTGATPGIAALLQGQTALRSHQIKYATGRFRVAASWGSKIAQYNLGLMYWNGYGVLRNHSTAVAWLGLADQRHNSAKIGGSLQFAYAKLTSAEKKQSNVEFNDLSKTYADKVALLRARDAWLRTVRSQTGSHLGAGAYRVDGAGLDASPLACNPYWPYSKTLKLDPTTTPGKSSGTSR